MKMNSDKNLSVDMKSDSSAEYPDQDYSESPKSLLKNSALFGGASAVFSSWTVGFITLVNQYNAAYPDTPAAEEVVIPLLAVGTALSLGLGGVSYYFANEYSKEKTDKTIGENIHDVADRVGTGLDHGLERLFTKAGDAVKPPYNQPR